MGIDRPAKIFRTTDGGATWALLPPDSRPDALAGEAAFAASGTSLAVLNDDRVWLSTGGPASRVWRSEDRGRHWEPVSSAVLEGSPSAGGFSVAFLDAQTGLTVGGDYKAESAAVGNAAFTADGGKTWLAVADRLWELRSTQRYKRLRRRIRPLRIRRPFPLPGGSP